MKRAQRQAFSQSRAANPPLVTERRRDVPTEDAAGLSAKFLLDTRILADV